MHTGVVVQSPEPMTFRTIHISRPMLILMVVTDVVVALAAILQVVEGNFPSLAYPLFVLAVLTLGVLYPGSAITAEGVRVPGRKAPVPWTHVEAFDGYLRGQVLLVEMGRVEPRRLRGVREGDLPALRAWLTWARSNHAA